MASNVIPWNRDQPAEQADLGPAGTTNQRKDGASPWRRARFLVFIGREDNASDRHWSIQASEEAATMRWEKCAKGMRKTTVAIHNFLKSGLRSAAQLEFVVTAPLGVI